jgi:hypothetical protein
MSVTVGDVVVGVVGASMRRGLALIGPSVNIGARLLKHAATGAIIASGDVFEELRRAAGRLADEFHPLDAAFIVPGADGMTRPTSCRRPRQWRPPPGSSGARRGLDIQSRRQVQVALLGQGGSYSTSPVRMATPASRRPTPSSVTATM